jgi:hypothetical protein
MDFEKAHKHMAYIIRLKLSIFASNPHKALVIGHPDISVARRCCKEMYDAALAEGEEAAHPWIKALVFDDRLLRHEFVKFVSSDSDFSSLRCLAIFRARVRLVPLVETYVESRHKDIKQEGRAKMRVSASRVSLKLRGAEIEKILEEGPEFLTALAATCSKLRSMSGLLQTLDLSTHPAVTSCIEENGNLAFDMLFAGHNHHALVERVIYRKDPGTQFRNLQAFGDDVNPNQNRGKMQCGAGTYEAILHAAATDHFRAAASSSAYYSHNSRVHADMVPISMALTSARPLFDMEPGMIDFTCEASLVQDGLEYVAPHPGARTRVETSVCFALCISLQRGRCLQRSPHSSQQT